MCWCWGAFQAFYGIEASFIRSKSWHQHLACLLSGLTFIVLVLPHWNCTLYIYNFSFCSIASTHRSSGKSSLTRSMLGSGTAHIHACAFYLVGQDQSHAPSLQRNDVPGPFRCLGCLHSSTSGFRWSSWSHVSFFFFYEVSQPWCVSHCIVWMLCKES